MSAASVPSVAVVVGPAIQAVEPSITRHVIVPAYVFPEPSAGLIRDHSPTGSPASNWAATVSRRGGRVPYTYDPATNAADPDGGGDGNAGVGAVGGVGVGGTGEGEGAGDDGDGDDTRLDGGKARRGTPMAKETTPGSQAMGKVREDATCVGAIDGTSARRRRRRGGFGPATGEEGTPMQAEEKDRREAENKASIEAPSARRLIQHASPNAWRNPRSAQLGLQPNVVSSHSRSDQSAFAGTRRDAP